MAGRDIYGTFTGITVIYGYLREYPGIPQYTPLGIHGILQIRYADSRLLLEFLRCLGLFGGRVCRVGGITGILRN